MKYKWLIELVGLAVALVALIISCQSNEMTKANQSKLERLECFDKVEQKSNDLVSSYRKALSSATVIHNNYPKRVDVTNIHTEFQSDMIKTLKSVKDLSHTVKRYDFKCNSEVDRIFDEVNKMGEMVKGTDTYEQFGGFNSKLQNHHHDNITLLSENDVADACCSRR